MTTIADALNALFANFQGLRHYLLALLGLGTLTMSVLQVIKDITPARRWFQMYRLKRYLGEHAAIACSEHHVTANKERAEEQIVRLATDGDAKAFYNLEIEKMCGQWNAAVQIALDSPHLYPDFFDCIAARAADRDFKLVRARALPELLPAHEETKLADAEQKDRLKTRHDFAEARARVSHQVQRTVDAFQISTSFRWAWLLQLLSYAISFGFALAALRLAVVDNKEYAMLSAALAGFLAPVARDLLASLQKLRS